MSAPDRRGLATLGERLRVRRNAKIGFATGLATALFAYAYRVGELGGPPADTRGSALLFFLLAIVLAVSLGALVAGVLTLLEAVRLATAE